MFGPYPNVTAARNTVNLLNRLYPLRKCTTYNKVPCLYYHIGQCLGYCTYKQDQKKINQMKEEILSFLKGDDTKVKQRLEEEMLKESDKKLKLEIILIAMFLDIMSKMVIFLFRFSL